ncbi:hypothetical protein [Gaiella sp.]|uniref:hypothetical protein n=1 Tax=Gaiella sp. TaxID=2663207 RepID=UPI00326566C3
MQAARRIGLIVVGVVAVTLLGSLVGSLLVGTSVERAVSTGLYVVGSFFLVLGFFSGVRGPARPRSTDGDEEKGESGHLFGVGIAGRGARTATVEERRDARGTTWLFIFLGAALIAAGIIVDGRASLI